MFELGARAFERRVDCVGVFGGVDSVLMAEGAA